MRRAGPALGACSLLAVPATAQAEDFTVTNLADDGNGSLRDAIDDANAAGGADRILFASKLSGTINLSDELYISDALQIVGPGARVLTVRALDDHAFAANAFDELSISGLSITALAGSGIYSTIGDLEVERSTLSGSDGRGIFFAEGDLSVRNSTVSDNVSSGVGVRYGVATVENSTVSGNGTGGFFGAGINLYQSVLERLESSTLVANNAGFYPGGGVYAYQSTVEDVTGSIVAGNVSSDGSDVAAINSVFEDVGFSLIGDPGNVGITSSGGNRIGVNPNLSPLRDNGGPTNTHAIGKNSPAKNAGPTSGAPGTDQRGAPRKGRADIGAYELVKCKGIEVDVVGTSGKDRLRGDGTVNGILGLGGADKLIGLQNRDALCGSGGKDKLIGGNGRDKLLGGGGKDLLKGGKAADKLNGGPGNDRCVPGGGPGNDKLKSC